MPHGYKTTIVALADRRVRFVVAGGVAAVLHGVERVTMDLDIALDMSAENVSRFIAVMKELGLRPRVPVRPEVLMDPSQVREIVEKKGAIVFTFDDIDRPFVHVDVFLTQELSFPVLSADAETVDVGGREVLVVSRRKLLELKRRIDPPRPKDVLDIAELERLIGEEQ